MWKKAAPIDIGKPVNVGPPFAEVPKVPPLPVYKRPKQIEELNEELLEGLDEMTQDAIKLRSVMQAKRDNAIIDMFD